MKALQQKTRRLLLTQRELEVIELITYEYSSKEIANRLYIGYETVKTHRKNIQVKLGVKNVAGIVREAFLQDLLNFNQNLTIAS